MRHGRLVLIGLVAVTVAVGSVSAVGAESGPQITVDRTIAVPGDPVIVTMTGFTGSAITVAVCGNLANRGSTDCNLRASRSEGREAGTGPTLTQLIVQSPPVPCPCLIRAASITQDEFAVVPIDIPGHPVAPVVESDVGPLVDVSITARRVDRGIVGGWRSVLGGPTPYAVEITVRNRSTETLSNVTLSAGATRFGDNDAVSLDVESVASIAPGRTWQSTSVVDVPAPVIGRLEWSAVASGAGSTVRASQTSNNSPFGLVVVFAALVLDLGYLMVRNVRRRVRHREPVQPWSVGPRVGARGANSVR